MTLLRTMQKRTLSNVLIDFKLFNETRITKFALYIFVSFPPHFLWNLLGEQFKLRILKWCGRIFLKWILISDIMFEISVSITLIRTVHTTAIINSCLEKQKQTSGVNRGIAKSPEEIINKTLWLNLILRLRRTPFGVLKMSKYYYEL